MSRSESSQDKSPEEPLAVTTRGRIRPAFDPSVEPVETLPETLPEKPVSAYEARLRREVDGFQFDSLIQGVQNSPAPVPPPRGSEPTHSSAPASDPVVSSPKKVARPNYNGVTVFLCWLAALAVGGLLVNQYWIQPRREASDMAAMSVAPATKAAATKPSAPPVTGSTRPGLSPGLPDPELTPGEAKPGNGLPADALAQASSAPVVSAAVRRKVFASYRIAAADQPHFVLCCLIPSSLWGTTTPANVFPVTPWFADLKMRLDKELTQRILSGKLTVAEAQQDLRTNWVRATHKYTVRNYGVNDRAKVQNLEQQLNWK